MKKNTTQVKRVERRPQLEEEADSDLAAQVLMLANHCDGIVAIIVMMVVIVMMIVAVILTIVVMTMIVTNSPKLSKSYNILQKLVE